MHNVEFEFMTAHIVMLTTACVEHAFLDKQSDVGMWSSGIGIARYQHKRGTVQFKRLWFRQIGKPGIFRSYV